MAGLKFLLFFTSIFFCRAQEQPSAALVIGGYTSADVNRESISNRVELFGCDQNLDYVVDVEPFPERVRKIVPSIEKNKNMTHRAAS